MSVIQVQMSTEEILKAVAQLSDTELDEFLQDAATIRARRKAPCLSKRESELLSKINQGFPEKLQRRYDKLRGKMSHGDISDEEYKELLRLTQKQESYNAQWLEWLIELAQIRRKSLDELIDNLGVRRPAYV